MKFVFDSVDTVKQPAFVVPTSLRENDYFQQNSQSRSKVTFTSVGVNFLFRDKWVAMNNDTMQMAATEFDKSKSVRGKRNRLDSLVTHKLPAAKVPRLNKAVEQEEAEEEEDEEDEENARATEELDVIEEGLGDTDE